MTNKQTFIKAIKEASKVFVGTQLVEGNLAYVQAVKADILYSVKDFPSDAEMNYTIQDSSSGGSLVFIN